MQMLSPWGTESKPQDYSYTSWSISSYVSENLHMQLPRVCVHFWAHTALIRGSAHLTPPRPQHSHLSWLILHFPMGLRPLLTEEHSFCTSVIHTWHSPMGQPALDRGHHPCHERARDWQTYQSWHCHERLHVNIGVSFSLPCSCIPRPLSTHTREAFSLWWLWIWWHWCMKWAHSFGILALREAENRLCSWIWWKSILGPKT